MKRQLELNLFKGNRGGRRPGSGRKRLHSQGIAHRRRERVCYRHALHVNFKLKVNIRNKQCLKLLKKAILNARKHGLRVIHFSLQSNHVHLILEAQTNHLLTKGMRSLTITFAKGIGKGRVQIERYHLHVLRSLKETRHAVHYVLFNEQKHRGLKKAYINEYSSISIVRDLKLLAQSARMTVIFKKISEMNFLDIPQGWVIRQVLNQQVC